MIWIVKPPIHELMKLPFCYACGRQFTKSDEVDRDHIPPKACFAGEDRNSSSVLELPAHKGCNGAHHLDDERVGQLVSLLHGCVPKPQHRRLKIVQRGDGIASPRRSGITNVDIKAQVRLWVRGFHAALYREPLLGTAFSITTPFPEARLTAAGPQLVRIKRQHLKFVEIIKLNRAAETFDCLNAWSEKLRYDCVWVRSDQGPWICVFALDLYGWKRLGDVKGLPARGCAGFYKLPSGNKPASGAAGAAIIAPALNLEPLDPFGL